MTRDGLLVQHRMPRFLQQPDWQRCCKIDWSSFVPLSKPRSVLSLCVACCMLGGNAPCVAMHAVLCCAVVCPTMHVGACRDTSGWV
jgi:hypothetical protein